MHVSELFLSALLVFCISFQVQATTPSPLKPYEEIVSPTFEHLEESTFKTTMDVRAFAQDKQGYLWLGAEQGLLRYDGYQIKRVKYAPNDDNYQIQDIAFDRNSNIWISTEWNGVFKFNIKTKQQQHFFHHEDEPFSLTTNKTTQLYINHEGVWVATLKGLNLINPANMNISKYFNGRNNEDVLDITEDQQHNLLVATNNGVYIKRPNTFEFFNFDAITSEGKSLSNKKIRRVYVAKDDSIWVSTVSAGNWRLDLRGNTLHQLDTILNLDTANAQAIIQVNDNVWFWTHHQGILSYDINSRQLVKNIMPDPSTSASLTTALPLSFFEDQSGLIWLGAEMQGLQFFNPKNSAFRVANKSSISNKKLTIEMPRAIIELENEELLISDSNSQTINRVDKNKGLIDDFSLTTPYENTSRKLTAQTFAQIEKGNVWIGTYPAFIVQYDLNNRKSSFYRAPLKKQRHGAILSMLEDPNTKQLWLGMSEGMLKFNPTTKAFSKVAFDFKGPLFFIYFDSHNNLWTGNKNGLFLLNSGQKNWRHFNKTNTPSLSDHAIFSVLDDKAGNIWIGTESDIFLLDDINETSAHFSSVKRKLGVTIHDAENLFEDKLGRIWSSIDFLFDPLTWKYRKITDKDTRDLDHYNQVFTKDRSGTVIMGGATSVTFIEPEKLSDWTYIPPTVINQVLVDSAPTQPIDNTLVVPASAKRFSIDFASIDFSEPENLSYRYRLIGYNEQWSYVEANNRHISYTSLSPGDYSFEVTGKNRSGKWSPKFASLSIKVSPSFYQTQWFKITATILVSFFIYLVIRWRINIVLKRERDAIEKQEALNHAELMDELMRKKNQLLADVSHELGTPLTVLKLQVEALKDDIEEDVQATYNSLDNKLSDIGHLIGDIHQLAQADTGTLQIHKQELDINEAIQNWENNLRDIVKSSELVFSVNNQFKHKKIIHCDRDKIKQVLSNLLANSVKYTDTPGKIKLSIKDDNDKVVFLIEDSKPGVDEKDLVNIFERLFRVKVSRSRETGGSGLGLAICKSLVEAHNGKIYAEQSSLGGLKIIIELPTK